MFEPNHKQGESMNFSHFQSAAPMDISLSQSFLSVGETKQASPTRFKASSPNFMSVSSNPYLKLMPKKANKNSRNLVVENLNTDERKARRNKSMRRSQSKENIKVKVESSLKKRSEV